MSGPPIPIPIPLVPLSGDNAGRRGSPGSPGPSAVCWPPAPTPRPAGCQRGARGLRGLRGRAALPMRPEEPRPRSGACAPPPPPLPGRAAATPTRLHPAAPALTEVEELLDGEGRGGEARVVLDLLGDGALEQRPAQPHGAARPAPLRSRRRRLLPGRGRSAPPVALPGPARREGRARRPLRACAHGSAGHGAGRASEGRGVPVGSAGGGSRSLEPLSLPQFGWKRALGSPSPACGRALPCHLRHGAECRVQPFLKRLQGRWLHHLPVSSTKIGFMTCCVTSQ